MCIDKQRLMKQITGHKKEDNDAWLTRLSDDGPKKKEHWLKNGQMPQTVNPCRISHLYHLYPLPPTAPEVRMTMNTKLKNLNFQVNQSTDQTVRTNWIFPMGDSPNSLWMKIITLNYSIKIFQKVEQLQ